MQNTLENFKDLGLTDEILQAIERSGFDEPTPIQYKTLPLILEGLDLLIEAQTGSGKTACFAWPILQKISSAKKDEKPTVQALILTPTRELALQVSGALYRFGEYQTPRVSVLTIMAI